MVSTTEPIRATSIETMMFEAAGLMAERKTTGKAVLGLTPAETPDDTPAAIITRRTTSRILKAYRQQLNVVIVGQRPAQPRTWRSLRASTVDDSVPPRSSSVRIAGSSSAVMPASIRHSAPSTLSSRLIHKLALRRLQTVRDVCVTVPCAPPARRDVHADGWG